MDDGVGAQGHAEGVRSRREDPGEDDTPARGGVRRRAEHGLAAAVEEPALPAGEVAEDGERVEPGLGQGGDEDAVRPLGAAAKRVPLPGGRRGDRLRLVGLEVRPLPLEGR